MSIFTKARIIFGLISLVMTLAASAAENQNPLMKYKKPAAGGKAFSQELQQATTKGFVMEFAYKNGLKKCLAVIQEQENSFTGGKQAITKNTLHTDKLNPDPNAWVLTSNIETVFEGESKFSSFIVRPFEGICLLDSTLITNFSKSCEEVQQHNNKDLMGSTKEVMHRVTERAQNPIYIYFLPVLGNKCAVIRREFGGYLDDDKGERK